MALADKIDALNTVAEERFQSTFGMRPEGTASQYADEVPVSDGESVEIAIAEGAPGFAEWVGEKRIGGLRTLSKTFKVRTFHTTLQLPRKKVEYQGTDLLSRRLQQWIDQSSLMFDWVAYTGAGLEGGGGLSANPTGYDGVALLANSHPFVGGSGTTDNLVGSAISAANLDTTKQKFRLMKDEAGEPLLAQMTHLMVGPQDEQKAKYLTDSNRPVQVDQDGEINSGSNSAGGVLLQNYTGGDVDVIVNPRITTGSEWYGMDLSNPDLKPMLLLVWKRPELVTMTDPTDDNVFHDDMYIWSIVADVAPVAGDWHRVVGNT